VLVLLVELVLPLCVSVDGLLGKEVAFFIHRLADNLSTKPFSVVMGWIRARLAFAVLRAMLVCVRRSRQKWRSLGKLYYLKLTILETFIVGKCYSHQQMLFAYLISHQQVLFGYLLVISKCE